MYNKVITSMDPQTYPNTYSSDSVQQRRLQLGVNLLIALVLIFCAALWLLSFTDYGQLRLVNIPRSATIRINDHAVSSTSLRLRAGTYAISVSSPFIEPFEGSVHIGMFQTKTLQPRLNPRATDAIFSSTLGAVVGSSAMPHANQARYFDGNTWVVGLLVPGGIEVAIHYNQTSAQWVVGFCSGTSSGYPSDLSQLPADVAAYVKQAEAHNGQGF